MRKIVLLLFILALSLSACGESEKEKRAREARKAEIEKHEEEKAKKEAILQQHAIFLSSWSEEVKKGEAITKRLLGHKDNRIQIPVTMDDMQLILYVRKQDWNKLKQEEREYVALYMKSMIPEVKSSDASQYSMLDKSAPVYNRYMSAVPNMCLDCWGIWSSDFEKKFVIGDEPYARKGSPDYETSFSAFSKNKYDSAQFQGQDTRGQARLAAMTPLVSTQVTDLTYRAAKKYIDEHYPKASIKRSSAVSKVNLGGKEVTLIKINFIYNGNEFFGDFYTDKWSESLYKVVDAKIRKH